MMTVTVEMEDIDLTGSPPCQIITGRGKCCGKPAAHRVLSVCPACGPRRIFICPPCTRDILCYGGLCVRCGSSRGIDGYC